MIEVRPFDLLGKANHGWLDTSHHFSFARYHDPSRMGWGALRVWNDDWIAGQSGFPAHSHDNMEIITFVRTGTITHRDSMGNEGRTDAGDVQVMSAGTGITHSEYNAGDDPVTLFQIWIMPDHGGAPPAWDHRAFPHGDRAGRWVVLASGMHGDAGPDVMPLRCDARVCAVRLKTGEIAELALDPSRHQYCVATGGGIEINGIRAEERDGIAITQENLISVRANAPCEILLVDTR